MASNPFEVIMIRQINDGALPSQFRRNYRSISDGIQKIKAQEGPEGFLKGMRATILKAIALNASNFLII